MKEFLVIYILRELTRLNVERVLGAFVRPKIKVYFGKVNYGAPYFYPKNLVNTIISIRRLKFREFDEQLRRMQTTPWQNERNRFKNLPMVRRGKNFIINILENYFYVEIGFPLVFYKVRLGWKDKFGTPRFEYPPTIGFILFNLQLHIWLYGDHNYWEQILWTEFYNYGIVEKAREAWPWVEFDSEESTWNNNFLKT